MTRSIIHHLLPVCVSTLALGVSAHAFTGDYAITGPTTPPGVYEGAGDITLGNWTANLAAPTSFVASSITTFDVTQPEPVVSLRSTVSFPQTGTLQSNTYLSIVIAESGTLDFDLSFTSQAFNAIATSGGFTLNSVNVINFTGSAYGTLNLEETISLPVIEGDILSFYALTTVGQISNDFDSRYGISTTSIANLRFTAAPIPEPAGVAALAGAATLGFLGMRRRPRA